MPIRPKAICVCRDGDRILVARAYDPAKREHFFIPLGGGVEFGEYAADAARRELREELGAEVDDVTLLGVLENIFTYDGAPGHEIVFVFDARLVDATLYARDEIDCGESDGAPFTATWLSLRDAERDGVRLYPEGLLALLGQHGPAR